MREMIELELAGRAFTVRPVTVGVLPKFLAAALPLASELVAGDLYGALATNAEALIEATALGAGVERAWLDAQAPDVLAELAGAVLEVNADFFVRRVLPAITRIGETVTGLAAAQAPDEATGSA